MRFYELNLYQPDNLTAPVKTWSSFPNGRFDPNALDVEFECMITPAASPTGGSAVRIHGIALQDLMQSQNFGMHYLNGVLQPGLVLELKGGMGKGLPLANPAQAGTLLIGTITQAFGQWEGTEMYVDFIVNGTQYTPGNPGNYTFNWQPGQTLQAALQNCLSVAHPNVPIVFAISPLTLNHVETHYCATIEELGQYIKGVTTGILNSAYRGVDIRLQAGKFLVSDGTQPTAPTQINFTDMIGQPTWINLGQMQIKTVLRGDIQTGNQILMPQGYVSGPGSAVFQPSQQTVFAQAVTFNGAFEVFEMRHVGHFRSTNGTDWATVMTCAQANPTS